MAHNREKTKRVKKSVTNANHEIGIMFTLHKLTHIGARASAAMVHVVDWNNIRSSINYVVKMAAYVISFAFEIKKLNHKISFNIWKQEKWRKTENFQHEFSNTAACYRYVTVSKFNISWPCFTINHFHSCETKIYFNNFFMCYSRVCCAQKWVFGTEKGILKASEKYKILKEKTENIQNGNYSNENIFHLHSTWKLIIIFFCCLLSFHLIFGVLVIRSVCGLFFFTELWCQCNVQGSNRSSSSKKHQQKADQANVNSCNFNAFCFWKIKLKW